MYACILKEQRCTLSWKSTHYAAKYCDYEAHCNIIFIFFLIYFIMIYCILNIIYILKSPNLPNKCCGVKVQCYPQKYWWVNLQVPHNCKILLLCYFVWTTVSLFGLEGGSSTYLQESSAFNWQHQLHWKSDVVQDIRYSACGISISFCVYWRILIYFCKSY